MADVYHCDDSSLTHCCNDQGHCADFSGLVPHDTPHEPDQSHPTPAPDAGQGHDAGLHQCTPDYAHGQYCV